MLPNLVLVYFALRIGDFFLYPTTSNSETLMNSKHSPSLLHSLPFLPCFMAKIYYALLIIPLFNMHFRTEKQQKTPPCLLFDALLFGLLVLGPISLLNISTPNKIFLLILSRLEIHRFHKTARRLNFAIDQHPTEIVFPLPL